MTKLFKKAKIELFFLYKLFNPKYTPVCAGNFRCYFNYFKNRFFGKYYLKNLPKFNYEQTDDLEVHVLVQKDDIWPLVWTLRSFLFYSGLRPAIVVHDDGSLDAGSIGILTSKFSHLRVISRAEADKTVFAWVRSELVLSHRKHGHPLILKLVDIFFLSRASNIMVLDSDILFFKKPAEIVEFIRGGQGPDSLISGLPATYPRFGLLVKKSYLDKYGLIGKDTELMNSGIILYRRSSVSEAMLYEYFENCMRKPGDYFVEMTGWNCMIAQTNFKFLPFDKYIIKGRILDTTVAKHYTSGRRQELYAHGIDLLKNKCLKK